MRYVLKFGYNGYGFSGYARQPELRTVEGDIIQALKKTQIIMDLDGSRFRSASRTDKGVSSRGNVIAFDTMFRKEEILGALNAHLDNIWFYGLAEVDDDFNPRHAKKRWYRYLLIHNEIVLNRMQQAAQIFIGEHDFSNFAQVEDRDPVRTLESIEISKEGNMLILDFRAQSFLWHMVRRIVKALIDASKDVISLDDVNKALDGKEKMDLGIAPPEPLILMDVEYDFDFVIDEEQLEKVKGNIKELLLEWKIQNTILEQMLGIQ
jgi:tRNA pseudouridine38-40 synthase